MLTISNIGKYFNCEYFKNKTSFAIKRLQYNEKDSRQVV